MNDSKLRCRCTGTHGCACTQAGKPVPVPASLPGRLAGAMTSTTPRRTVTRARQTRGGGGLDSPLAASVRRRAVQEDVFRSASAAERVRVGLPAAAPPPSRVWTSAAVPWRTAEVLTASAMRQPFYGSDADEDAAVKAFEQAAAVIAHGESGSLPGEPLSGAQEGMVHAYGRLMTLGHFESAARVLDSLRRSAARVRRDRMRAVMAGLESRAKGEVGALVASGQRRKRARLDAAADRILGPERAGQIRQMQALRQRVDRVRASGSGAAA